MYESLPVVALFFRSYMISSDLVNERTLLRCHGSTSCGIPYNHTVENFGMPTWRFTEDTGMGSWW